ncbi:hypothetical protein C4D60_Mb03t01630 [Musa balbisiana]|uniref:Secreted protein n=1 Tax=Musa balbisiana TaxID=52838 RepID=A0A4S8J7U8_MUSBA|nr:hypothetical protein C4D60_Mb03t01630 [Musa balbisiana]
MRLWAVSVLLIDLASVRKPNDVADNEKSVIILALTFECNEKNLQLSYLPLIEHGDLDEDQRIGQRAELDILRQWRPLVDPFRRAPEDLHVEGDKGHRQLLNYQHHRHGQAHYDCHLHRRHHHRRPHCSPRRRSSVQHFRGRQGRQQIAGLVDVDGHGGGDIACSANTGVSIEGDVR